MNAGLTYVYCLVSSPAPPSVRRAVRGVPGGGRIRILPLADGVDRRGAGRSPLWAVVAGVPAAHYDERAISKGLADLDWVARIAVAHERVIESFLDAPALLPMKLFTLFKDDERAIAHLRRRRRRFDALAARVAKSCEWGVRVVLDPAPLVEAAERRARERRAGTSGARYLEGKKARRDVAATVTRRARTTVSGLYGRLSADARAATRRDSRERSGGRGSLVLDAAFLVSRAKTAPFRATVAREARRLGAEGYGITLTGPWPPYSFMRP
jgi:hypothetical protein